MAFLEIEQLQIRVTERHGIRRFLYPLQVALDSELPGDAVLVDGSGTLVPQSIKRSAPDKSMLRFAISIGPHESALLRFEPANGRVPIIPDPLQITAHGAKIRSRQEKVAFGFGEDGLLHSTVYDGTEHISTPQTLRFNGHPAAQVAGNPAAQVVDDDSGLCARLVSRLRAQDAVLTTTTQLTCCKSWIEQEVKIGPLPGSSVISSSTAQPFTLAFAQQMTIMSPMQTCDFGMGNGAYARLETGKSAGVEMSLDLPADRAPAYSIRVQQSADGSMPRVDYAGRCASRDDALSRLWLHWNEPAKALAVAVTQIAGCWDQVRMSLSDTGMCTVAFHCSGSVLPADNAVNICWHFLNAIPPIAAATNPASIICKPDVVIEASPRR